MQITRYNKVIDLLKNCHLAKKLFISKNVKKCNDTVDTVDIKGN